MTWSFIFFFNSILLGIGLAMDAFSVSLTNGLNEPDMKPGRMNLIAGLYGFFQFLMPLAGWICVHTIVEKFTKFEKFIPWIALALLLYLGIEMLSDGIKSKKEQDAKEKAELSFWKLIMQGIATSIDALSVGFTIEQYNFPMAFTASLIIGIITHIICVAGLVLGKKFGTRLSGKASILGGFILIGIGIEIFITGVIV